MRRTMLAVAFVPALLLAPVRATGSTISQCQAAIATLSLETQGTTFLGPNAAKVEARLLFHLAKASSSLDLAAFKDAFTQMGDYTGDLRNAVGAGTVAAGDAAFLETGAAGVVACIQAIPK